jgi:hypothetical protein
VCTQTPEAVEAYQNALEASADAIADAAADDDLMDVDSSNSASAQSSRVRVFDPANKLFWAWKPLPGTVRVSIYYCYHFYLPLLLILLQSPLLLLLVAVQPTTHTSTCSNSSNISSSSSSTSTTATTAA